MLQERIKLHNNSDAYMDTFILDDPLKEGRKRPVVLICPGGGYEFLSSREAEPVALRFNAAGIHAIVVYYTVGEKYPMALCDLSEAVVNVRKNAQKWLIDDEKIIICGFSAGGHLAASLGVFWNSETEILREDKLNKPNGLVLSYPVITSGDKAHNGSINILSGGDKEIKDKVSLENHVNDDCPPTFIWHTFTDTSVPVENSVYFVNSLIKNNIPTEFHLYPKGRHGLSLATEFVSRDGEAGVIPEVQEWIKHAIRWINQL